MVEKMPEAQIFASNVKPSAQQAREAFFSAKRDDFDYKFPRNSSMALLRPASVSAVKIGSGIATLIKWETGNSQGTGTNRHAVLKPKFEHLSYLLDRHSAANGVSFSAQGEEYSFFPVSSETHAQIILGASDWVAIHASEPVGIVRSGEGKQFLLCRTSGRKANELSKEERSAFSQKIVGRLAALNSQGFSCGGLSPDAVMFTGKEAKILNPSSIYALDEEDSPFYDAVVALRRLVSDGMVGIDMLGTYADAYLSSSPVCRHETAKHLQKKGQKDKPREALVKAAKKFAYL
jgi:hypothetical protein